jgi:hypothetical protein
MNTPTRFAMLLAATTALASTAGAVTVIRGPYLQMPSNSSMTVRWRTDVPTDSRVSYGTTQGVLTTDVDDGTPTTEHEVPLTGLADGTEYFYEVGSTSGALVGNDADHRFRTNPTPGTDQPIRLWAIGDSGFVNPDHVAVRDAYAAFAAGTHTDLLLPLGDNAYNIGTDAEYQAAFFDMYQDLLRRTPAMPTFGNHEAVSSNTLTETGPWFDMFTLPRLGELGGVMSGTEGYYSFDLANVHFIVLDSHFSDRSPGGTMLTWLEDDLMATTADWIIAYWHHPPYSKGLLHDSDIENREIQMRENALPILEDLGVDLVLSGHSHSYERSNLLDGHYGFSTELDPSMVLDSGDGDADGAYRKASVGPAAHEGAVYVVAGSTSDVRNTTLNHPAMEIGLLEFGALVVDIDGNELTGTFLNDLGQASDVFRISKGAPACPATARSGCENAGKAKLVLKKNVDPSRDRFVWKWKQGLLDAGDVGNPTDQTDLAVCVYDAGGTLLGTALAPNAADPDGAWRPKGIGGFSYKDSAAPGGILKMRVSPGDPSTAKIAIKGKGAGLGLGTLPVALPVTAQLANLDGGACWEAVYSTAKRNEAAKVVAP